MEPVPTFSPFENERRTTDDSASDKVPTQRTKCGLESTALRWASGDPPSTLKLLPPHSPVRATLCTARLPVHHFDYRLCKPTVPVHLCHGTGQPRNSHHCGRHDDAQNPMRHMLSRGKVDDTHPRTDHTGQGARTGVLLPHSATLLPPGGIKTTHRYFFWQEVRGEEGPWPRGEDFPPYCLPPAHLTRSLKRKCQRGSYHWHFISKT